MTIPPHVKEALIAAGGCDHTPEPQRGCDTCGRAPAEWAKNSQVVNLNWRVKLADGRIVDKRDVISVANLPENEIARMVINTDNPKVPFVRTGCDPRKGERIRVFNRRATRIGTRVGAAVGGTNVLVIEIGDVIEEMKFVRLYIHPEQGLILSTEDLYF